MSLHFKASHRLASLCRNKMLQCVCVFHGIPLILCLRTDTSYTVAVFSTERAYWSPMGLHSTSSAAAQVEQGTKNGEWKFILSSLKQFLCSLHYYTFRQPESERLSKVCQIPGPTNIQSPTIFLKNLQN